MNAQKESELSRREFIVRAGLAAIDDDIADMERKLAGPAD